MLDDSSWKKCLPISSIDGKIYGLHLYNEFICKIDFQHFEATHLFNDCFSTFSLTHTFVKLVNSTSCWLWMTVASCLSVLIWKKFLRITQCVPLVKRCKNLTPPPFAAAVCFWGYHFCFHCIIRCSRMVLHVSSESHWMCWFVIWTQKGLCTYRNTQIARASDSFLYFQWGW